MYITCCRDTFGGSFTCVQNLPMCHNLTCVLSPDSCVQNLELLAKGVCNMQLHVRNAKK